MMSQCKMALIEILIQKIHMEFPLPRAINEPSSNTHYSIKLGLSIKIKCSTLAWTWDKLKTMFELEFVRMKKAWTRVGLIWLISLAKFKFNIKLKLELKSSFLAWDPK